MRDYSEINRKAYDKKAKCYDETLDGKFTEGFKSLLLDNIHVRDNDSILDIGCGNGKLLSGIEKSNLIQGFGVDISPEMIRYAKECYPKFNFVVSGCENIPFEDNSMDIIIVCAAYHHFPSVDLFAKEAKRLLKQNGSLYIAEIYLPSIVRHIVNLFLPLSKDGDVKLYSPKEIVNTFTNAGFYVERIIKKGHIQIVQIHI